MVHVESEAMTDVDYDPASSVLRIRFNDGHRYRYDDVPPHLAEAMMTTESHGRFFHDHIRDRFPYRRC